MFGLIVLILSIQLLTFGGVLPQISLLSAMLWSAGFFVVLLHKTLTGKTVHAGFIVGILIVIAIGLLGGGKYVPALFAGLWAWQAARDKPWKIPRLFHALMVIGLLEACLGLFQYFVNPGWILGYRNTVSAVSGTLINRNHFAGLIEMLAFVPFGMAYTRSRDHDIAGSYIYLFCSAFMTLALIFSLSRMGIFSFGLTATILFFLLRRQISGRRESTILVAGMMTLIFAGAFWIGISAVVVRYDNIVGKDEIVGEGRSLALRDTFKMIAANPLGVGPGKYQDLFRRYQSFRLETLYDHAHNDYLETAADWGIFPASAFWTLVILLLGRTIRAFLATESFGQQGLLVTCIGSCCVLLIHSLADFNFQIPVNATLFFAFTGIAVALSGASPEAEALQSASV